MAFRIEGLDPAPFAPFFALDDEQLAERGMLAVAADDDNYPCRISLKSAARGERLLLLNHEHQPAQTPYRSAHAIYVAEGSTERGAYFDDIPPIMLSRVLSIRAFDSQGIMVDADLVDGRDAASLIARLFSDRPAAYLHVHFAKRGCFAGLVERN
jgi:Protein of unknown function (DUF1203)